MDCEVKWGLRSTAVNKASGYNEIPAELFISLKENAIKVLHSLFQQIWMTQQWLQDWKRSTLTPVPKKGNTKECAIGQLHSSPMLVRSCLKSCMLGFSIMQTKNFQMSMLGLDKAEEPEIKLPNFSMISLDHRESKRIPGNHLPLFHQQW